MHSITKYSSSYTYTYLHIYTNVHTTINNLRSAFKALDDDIKFTLAAVIIAITYFGGAMYVTALSSSSSNSSKSSKSVSPAILDNETSYTVPSNLPADDKELFLSSFDQITKEIIDDLPTIYELPQESVKYIEGMIEYTVAGGKMTRGLTTMAVSKIFASENGRKLSNKERVQSAALGWCIEFLQAFFLVADDIMDSSVTRRGAPCWYKLPNVRFVAINDSFILESCVYKILKRYFGNEVYYQQLVDLFIEVTRQTEVGQLLDLTSQPLDSTIDISRFTIERYSRIVKYKTAFYTFYLPVALGMITAGITDIKCYQKAREILLIMGEYFQIQDDFLDCYGKPEDIGKIGTDIQDNKCSWLVIQAMKVCNSKQLAVLEDNYGIHDASNVNIVKKLYNELNMTDIFNRYEAGSYEKINKLIEEIDNVPKEIFKFLLSKTYKRTK